MAEQKEPAVEQYEIKFHEDNELHALSVICTCLERHVITDSSRSADTVKRVLNYINSKYGA